VHGVRNQEHDEYAKSRTNVAEAEGRVLDEDGRRRGEHREEGPESVLEFLSVVYLASLVREEVVQDVEEGGEAAAEYGRDAEERKHEQHGGLGRLRRGGDERGVSSLPIELCAQYVFYQMAYEPSDDGN